MKSDLKEFFSMGQVAPKDPKSALLSSYMITLRHPDWKQPKGKRIRPTRDAQMCSLAGGHENIQGIRRDYRRMVSPKVEYD